MAKIPILTVYDDNGNPIKIPALQGRGIENISRTSGNGSTGSRDVYTITYSDGTTSQFEIYNGKDGAPYVLTEADKNAIAEIVNANLGDYDFQGDVYTLKEGETLADVPDGYNLAYDPYGESHSSGGSGGAGGLTAVQIAALDAMFKAAAYAKSDVSTEYSAFKAAFGIGGNDEPDTPDTPSKTMVNISATYSGGDAPVGIALTDLIGITVTAYYSDGSTVNVTDYTLSGEIAEGQNRITVSYNGFTTLIYVNGVMDLPAYGFSNETTWTNGVVYDFVTVGGEDINKGDGSFIVSTSGWERTPYLYCEGADKLRFTLIEYTSMFGGGGNGAYNAFYDADKNFICSFHMGMTANNAEGDYVEVDVPENATYFACSHKGSIYSRYLTITPYGVGSSVEPDEPAKTMTALGATYSGGDAPIGMDIADLIGITVTVYYSDGSTANVTDYTMNGGIYNEGGNVITVFYNGFSTQFVVFGVANEPEYGVSTETTWTNGVVYDFVPVGGEEINKGNGSFIVSTSGWERTPYLYCEGADKLRFTLIEYTSMFGGGGNGAYNAFYDADKNFICSFHMGMTADKYEGDYVEVDVPENAAYFACSHKGSIYSRYLTITPYGEVE